MKTKLLNFVTKWTFVSVVLATCLLASCGDDEPPLPDNLANFQSAQQSLAEDEQELQITIAFSRALDVATAEIQIEIASGNTTYGEEYTTTPAASSGTISLVAARGDESISFTVAKEAVFLDGDEQITFSIASVGEGLEIGQNAELVLSFAEILASEGQMTIDGGGATYPNKVFIDLSANRQTAVNRDSWDLAFYSGSDFKVILNSSVTMFARPLDKADLAAVTAADTAGFAPAMNINAFSMAAFAWIDGPGGSLEETAIADVSANDSENVVYIINRGEAPAATAGAPGASRGWKKVKITRKDNGYLLSYADINSATVEELEIPKSETGLFTYAHFENGVVDVEPAKDRWDIAWTGFMNFTAFGGGSIPYYFQDIVIQNRHEVETAMVSTSDISYDNFSLTDAGSLAFSTAQNNIGATWRVTGGPGGSQPAVYEDRFYVIKDAGGNIYKLKFTALVQNGERGKPQIVYHLLE